jgi:hypothetical protein
MDKYEKRVLGRLHESGAELIRNRRHRKWKLSNGKIFTQPNTPGDWRNFRKQDSVLKRLLDTPNVEAMPQGLSSDLPNEAERRPVRFRAANNPARDKAVVHLPKLSPSSPCEPKLFRQFNRIDDLLFAVDDVPAFWELDCCGRVRVLMKLASRFAKSVEVLTAFAVIAPGGELGPYVSDDSEEAKNKRELAQRMRFYRDWGGSALAGERWCQSMIGMPCLRVKDTGGEVLIETSAGGLLLDTEELMVFSGLTFPYNCARASVPQWSDYERSALEQLSAHPYPFPDKGHLSYLFVDRVGMKKNNITYKVCKNWADPSVARKVIQSVYEYCSTSDRFSITEAVSDSIVGPEGTAS